MADAVWIDPMTGNPITSSTAPLGGPAPALPGGTAWIGDPMGQLYAVSVPAGGSADTAWAWQGDPTLNPDGTVSYNRNSLLFAYEADRGADFYFAGDEWKILQQQEDVGTIQSALEAIGALSGDYIYGEIDPKTAAAFAKVLAAANASGRAWQEVLTRGLDVAKTRGARGGSGSGPAPMTDEDIKAIGMKVAQGVLGRNLSEDEIANFIPAFRGATGGGVTTAGVTSPQTAAENVVRGTSPYEAGAHDAGAVMQTISRMLGG